MLSGGSKVRLPPGMGLLLSFIGLSYVGGGKLIFVFHFQIVILVLGCGLTTISHKAYYQMGSMQLLGI